MKASSKHIISFGGLGLLLVLCFLLNIALGSVNIPFRSILAVFFDSSAVKESWSYIVLDYRLPKAITAILVGAGLGVSGLLMQTLFRNPLAGPFVLGISSGASLGVALLIMGSSFLGGASLVLASKWGIVIAAAVGSFLVLLLVLLVSARVRDTMAILIIGLMFGSITAAIVSVLAFFSPSEQLQQYIFWSFGSLGDLSWTDLGLFAGILVLGLLLTLWALKGLNGLLLGEAYAQSLGLSLKRHRLVVILATSLLAGSVTAFAGPIAFIGLAIPHMARQLLQTNNHRILFPGVLLLGGILLLLCDTIAQLPQSELSLPINAVTAMIGAPVVIWLLVRKRNMIF